MNNTTGHKKSIGFKSLKRVVNSMTYFFELNAEGETLAIILNTAEIAHVFKISDKSNCRMSHLITRNRS